MVVTVADKVAIDEQLPIKTDAIPNTGFYCQLEKPPPLTVTFTGTGYRRQ
jgi:hypothetical protein